MTPQIIGNGEFEIVHITADLFDEVEEVFMEVFPYQENTCLSTKVRKSPEALAELRQVLRFVLADGISFGARHVASGRIVAFCGNKIFNPQKQIGKEGIIEYIKTPNIAYLAEFLERMESPFDIYKEWQVACAFELTFLAVPPQWGQRGLGHSLFAHSLEFARSMSQGKLAPEMSAQLSEQIREERPEVVKGIMTSLYTQKISQKCGLKVLTSIPMTEFSYDGKTFAECIEPQHKCAEFTALKL